VLFQLSDGRRVVGQLAFQARRDPAKPFGDGLSFVCPVQRLTQHRELGIRQTQRIELLAPLTVGIAQTIWIVWIHETRETRQGFDDLRRIGRS
jgi:hypothetical protein